MFVFMIMEQSSQRIVLVDKMKKLMLLLIAGMFLISFVSPVQQSLGTFKSGECVNLIQICDNCSYNNISRVIYPNSTNALSNVAMTKDDTFYNYTFCNASTLGTYIVNGYGDLDGVKTSWSYDFDITTTGENIDISDGIIIFAQFGFVFLLFGLGRAFKEWKIKLFFDISSILMAIIALNSIRIIATQSQNLDAMGEAGLIIGLIIVSFIFLYAFIHYTIEVFSYFKKKRDSRWKLPH